MGYILNALVARSIIKQGQQAALLVQAGELGITTDVQFTDPNLRHGALATGLHYFSTQLGIAIDGDIFKIDAQLF